MTIAHLTDSTLRGMIWLDEAARCLLDYRAPGVEVTARERIGLGKLYRTGMSPSAAADAYQAQSSN